MTTDRRANADFLAEVLAHIDTNLFAHLSVASLADVTGLSSWHFSRVFSARTGASVMGYVRARRLDAAAFKLASANPPSLIDLAFDCGFESQEAFTRAFRRQFGAPPGQYERNTTKHEMGANAMRDTRTKAHVSMKDGLVKRGAFTVAGPRAVFDGENKNGIPALWPALIKALPLDGQADGRSYGVMSMKDRDEGSIYYLAGVEVKDGGKLPKGFEQVTIPANSYAVFRLDLDGPNLHQQIQAAMPLIWGEMIPKAGLKIASAPDFEAYPDGFNPMAKGAYMEMWLPVEV
jgi:AraC family transcriptional regulator